MLRDYQHQAIAAASDSLSKNRSCLLVAATGVGKTTIFCEIIRRALSKGKRVCVMAHRDELIRQAASRIEQIAGVQPEIEKAGQWAKGDVPVFVTSVQTMNAKWILDRRFQRFQPDDWDLLIIDEAHHALAQSYRNVIDHFQKNPKHKVIGVTATPDRGDQLGLGEIFDDCPFQYEIGDAVCDGWLVPIRQQYVTVGSLDYSEIKTRLGDLCGGDLAEVLEQEKNIHGMVSPTLELLKGKSAIVFCATVRQAEMAAEVFNRHKEGIAACVHGKTSPEDRADILARFADGSLQFVTNVGVLTEGFDAPRCDAVVMMTATKVRAKYVQCVGRATRPITPPLQTMTKEQRVEAIGSSEKPFCTVIDFKGNSGRHKLIGMVDVLAGNRPEGVVDRAKRIIADEGVADPEDALRMAEIREEEEKQREEARQREILRKAKVKLKADYHAREVDPFARFDMTPVHPSDPKEQPSEKQQAMLMNNGVDPTGLTRKQAGRLVGDIMMRRKLGRPSLKQEAILDRYNLTARSSFEAKALIDEIAAAGWKLPNAPSGREPETSVLSGSDAKEQRPLPQVDGGRTGERDIPDRPPGGG
tara:strand:+ start:11536 stop:13293 length:1758 start_codon:yes stop_codon:yes gene_type:complete